MDSRGVSPMIATIVLIAIVFAIAAILALSLASAPQPTQPFAGQFSLENIESGKSVIVIKHTGGDKADEAVENRSSDNKWHWKNLELRVNGVVVGADNIVTFVSEGANAFGRGNGYYTVGPGDLIRVSYPGGLNKGDKVSLVWVPKKQVLQEKEVTG
jgi:flagellin-like protein